jgi:hypothetical protein
MSRFKVVSMLHLNLAILFVLRSSPVCIAVFEKWIREPESNTAVTAAAEQSRHTPVALRPAASSSSLSPLHQLKQRRKYEALQTSHDSDDDVPVGGDAGPGRSES